MVSGRIPARVGVGGRRVAGRVGVGGRGVVVGGPGPGVVRGPRHGVVLSPGAGVVRRPRVVHWPTVVVRLVARRRHRDRRGGSEDG